MAETYSLSVTPSCATATNGAGVLTCTTAYTSSDGPTPEGLSDLVLLRGGVEQARQSAGRNATFTFTSQPDATYLVEWRDEFENVLASSGAVVACSTSGGGGGGQPTVGCMLPNAFNYDQAATEDTEPSSCVLVLVDTAPFGQVAAHLPIPVVVRAAPTADGQPALVRLLLSTAPTPDAPPEQWRQFGSLLGVCAAEDQAASFNVSEAATTLLRIQPPVEEGKDLALSALLRVQYERLDPATREVTHAGLVGTCRVLNAVVQPAEGQELTTDGTLRLWQTSAAYTDGVVSAAGTGGDLCPTDRVFVWLNAAGAWDAWAFTGRHQHGTDVADGVGYRDLAGADRWASRGQVRPTLAVYSDLLDFATFQAVRGIRQSVQVYERASDEAVEAGAERYVPVRLNAESYLEYQEQTDKTYQVNFTVSYPAQLIQTQ